jgi:uncharacterized membrane protein YfcA
MIFPLSIENYLLSLIIITVGSILQGVIGFGLGIVSVPLLLLIEPAFVPGPLLLAALFLNILISRREKKDIDYPSLRWIIPGRVFGTIIGAAVLNYFPQNIISILFGTLVLIAVALSSSGLHLHFNPGNLLGVGTLSGFMATTTSIGGPPLALLYQRESGNRIRGTLSVIFIVGTILAVLSLVVIGRFGMKELILAVSSFPAILFGFLLSGKAVPILDKGYVRPAIFIFSAAAAIYVILTEIV